MNDSSDNNKTRRRPLRLMLTGCAALIALVVCALVINAVYWTVRMGPVATAMDPAIDVTPISVESLPTGDATNGEALFQRQGCSACHSLNPDEQGAGPSLAGVAARAAEHNSTAEAYLAESIVNPGAYVVEGFQNGIMPPGYGQQLTDQELADLVAFLITH